MLWVMPQYLLSKIISEMLKTSTDIYIFSLTLKEYWPSERKKSRLLPEPAEDSRRYRGREWRFNLV